MNGRWQLGKIKEELVMLPAPMSDEILEEFSPGEIRIEFTRNRCYVYYRAIGFTRYRMADTLAQAWLIMKGK